MLTSTAWWLSPQAGAHSTYNGAVFNASSQVIIEFWINTHAAIMGSKKSHDLLSATWRIRKAGGVIWSKSEGRRIGKLVRWIPSEFKAKHQEKQYLRVGEDEYLSWNKESEFTAFLFCSGPQWIRWPMSTCIVRWPSLLPLLTQANLFQRYPHYHPLKQCLPAIWASLSPIKLTHKVYHQTLCSKFLLTWKFLDITVFLGVPRPSNSSL